MTRLNEKDIEHRLTELEKPLAPAELAERIKAEIPDLTLLLATDDDPEGSMGPNASRLWRRPAIIAASALLAMTVAYRLVDRDGSPIRSRPAGEGEVAAATQSVPQPTDERDPRLQGLGYNDGSAKPSGSRPEKLLVATSSSLDLDMRGPELESSPAKKQQVKDLNRTFQDGQQRLEESPPGPSPMPAPEQPVSESPLAQRMSVDETMPARHEQLVAAAENPILDPTASTPVIGETLAQSTAIPEDTPSTQPTRRRSEQQEIAGASHRKVISEIRMRMNSLQDSSRQELSEADLRFAPLASPSPPSTGGSAEPNDQPYGDMFFRGYGTNPFIDTEDDPLSTFGLDVDTGSYTLARRYLDDGHLPPSEAIRVEEFINYFDYGDAAPRRDDFAIHVHGGPSPIAQGPRYQLVRFNLRARDVSAGERKPATLIFVVDVSGSMGRENRLGLVKRSLTMLLEQLDRDDRVGLVIYGSQGRVLLEPTSDLRRIERAIEELRTGGSTNAEEGLVLAYDLADRYYRDGTINRIVLCSDGVANVGRTGPGSILDRIGKGTRRGIELTTVGFGVGNYNDVLMEQLADQGNGNYAYVDALEEAHRVFVENLTGTLQTIAADAKVQVEFNPEVVSRYRLLGYENRDVPDHLFRDDTVDAGEIGAGHSVTALYAVKLVEDAPRRGRLAELRLRYHSKRSRKVEELSRIVRVDDLARSWDNAARELQLTAVVAEFAEVLKQTYWSRTSEPTALLERAQRASSLYAGDREVADLVGLVSKASRLLPPTSEE